MAKDYYIGIDAGLSTGWARWNAAKQEFDEIITTTFWGCIEKIDSIIHECWLEQRTVTFVIENPNLNSATFTRFHKGKRVGGRKHDHISQSVGMNKRDAQLLIEYCRSKGQTVIESQPTEKSNTKLAEPLFKNITRYAGGTTSQHGRDAAMLVYKIR